MTNKEYKAARAIAENADELFTFETWNGYSMYTNKYMDSNDLKEMRQEYKEIKAEKKAFVLDNFGGRALIIPVENGYILQSYYTKVAIYRNGEFFKTWNGYSVTTLKHINAFRKWINLPALSKREWIELPNEWEV